MRLFALPSTPWIAPESPKSLGNPARQEIFSLKKGGLAHNISSARVVEGRVLFAKSPFIDPMWTPKIFLEP
ncbi:MAG: hypothetical protein AUI50_04425 [Crenarchaeota archaeon 13_1_40CM_2_52_14]|nr:MAG: hypothetical protein AUI50_04425 [Crenarchaeota archaeon 13_1_40CM_2_52_14]